MIAKPSGISLQQHVSNVVQQCYHYIEQHPFVIEKYHQFTNMHLPQNLVDACLYHDEGKKHPLWQNACLSDSSGNALKALALRHEIHSLNLLPQHTKNEVKVAIAAHHSKLSYKHKHRWDDDRIPNAKQHFKNFQILSSQIEPDIDNLDIIIKNIYQYGGIRHLLQLCDRRASILEQNGFVNPFESFNYHFEFPEKNSTQSLIEQISDNDFILLRAPTGSGKTDAALLWAKRQIETKKADRAVFLLPTRFTSNAISKHKSIKEKTYHSSAFYFKYSEAIKQNQLSKNTAKNMHTFDRLLENPISVCTIDHIIMALTLSKEDHHGILFNLAHSCIIIDEFDFYDTFIQSNIIFLLRVLKTLNTPILIMSATLPDSTKSLINKASFNVNQIHDNMPSPDHRKKYSISINNELPEVNDKNTQLIIYANTVDSALFYYNYYKHLNPILYHSRFLQCDKKRIEEEILASLGKNGKQQGVIIMTQIGELSINISSQNMITEACPIDRFAQRIGRCNRFNYYDVGYVQVIIPDKPAPYGNFDLKTRSWIPSMYFTKSIEILHKFNNRYFISENDLVDATNEVYQEVQNYDQYTVQNTELLVDMFLNNYIILPNSSNDLEESEKAFKTRNILQQASVFVNVDYDIDTDFYEFKLENSVEIHAYIIKKQIAAGNIVEHVIQTKTEDKTVYAAVNCYSQKFGLVFSEYNDVLNESIFL